MDSREANDHEYAGRPKRRYSKIERRDTGPHRQQGVRQEHYFQYKPLDRSKGAVRLVKVYPFLKDEHVRCRIERHHTSTTAYIALSYVWGSDDACHTILLNGQIFRVRPNLYSFLRHVAKNRHFSDTLFWIDAISINQFDVGEKNGHVRHMGAIYSSASKVIAWLGHSSGPLTIRTKPPNRWICCGHWDPNNETSRRHSCDWKLPSKSSWEVIMHPYWSRLWIAQELGLASRVDVLWRGRFYNWFRLRNHLTSSVAQQRQLQVTPVAQKTPFSANVEFIKDLPIARYFKHAEAEPLGNLVPRFALHDCQIGHDHAYALLSLASDGDAFEPDYNESCISLLFRLLTFCYSHPTASFISKIGSALSVDPVGKGIAVEPVGRPHVMSEPKNVSGVHYQLIDHSSETVLNVSTDIIVRLPDTNLYLMFRASIVDGEESAVTSYNFLSRIDTVSDRVKQAKHKFGHRSKKKDNSWAYDEGMKCLQHMVLRGVGSTDNCRLYCGWQSVLAIFELSETEFARGRLESRIRSWAGGADTLREPRQAFTVGK